MWWNSVCKNIDIQAGTYGTYNLPEELVDLSANQASSQTKVGRKVVINNVN